MKGGGKKEEGRARRKKMRKQGSEKMKELGRGQRRGEERSEGIREVEGSGERWVEEKK